MKRANIIVLLGVVAFAQAGLFAGAHVSDLNRLLEDSSARSSKAKKTKRLQEKAPAKDMSKFSIKKGDSELQFGGSAKIEHYAKKNACLLNRHLPDSLEYFKHTVNIDFDYVYGKETFDHKALECFLRLRHKGFWGLSQNYTDRGSVTVDASAVSIAGVTTGKHSHSTGRALPWISEAWLSYSFNAAFGLKNDEIHSIKLGWFPFSLGRGIALGSDYGSNRPYLGVYGYGTEDKFAPGILLTGDILKDVLSYDLYFARMQEFNKSLSNTLDLVRANWISAQTTIPWRGSGKDNDLYAARLKWKAFDTKKCGKLDVEPYIYYNVADDSYVEFEPDASMKFGAYGLSTEYAWKNLEIGAEVAANYGKEDVVAYDRNNILLQVNATGQIEQVYSHIVKDDPVTNFGGSTKAVVNTDASNFAKNPFYRENGQGVLINGVNYYNKGLSSAVNDPNQIYNTPTKSNRFRPAYKNDLRGWMIALDGAYKIPSWNLKFAASYHFASGDANPHENEVNKRYKGFIGLNEWYMGKRVPSIFLLGQRNLQAATALTRNSDELESDIAFTDMHMTGLGATWTPRIGNKTLDINPNALFFFRDARSGKVILSGTTWEVSQTEKASKFMGSELNLVTKCEVLKDLTLFGAFAVFIPGSYFKDIAGVPLDNDYFAKFSKYGVTNPKEYRLGSDTAYHMNLGLDFKF